MMEVTDYIQSGTYFGSGTNHETGEIVADIKNRVKIFKHLTNSPSKIRWSLSMKFIERAFGNDKTKSYMLTEEGYHYWKNVDLGDLNESTRTTG